MGLDAPGPTYHDDVVPGEAGRELADVAPVRGLLAGDEDVGGADLHGACVRGQGRLRNVGLQQLHPLQPCVQARGVDGLQRPERLLQEPVDQVDGAVLKVGWGLVTHSPKLGSW